MKKIKKTSDAKDGGLFVGKSHDDGGIPAIVVDTGQPIEVEGGEAIINKKATAKHWKELSKINQSTGGVPIPPPDRADELMDKFEKGGKLTQLEKKTIHNKWKNLVNMTYTELRKYYDSKDGKTSGLTQKEADDLGIDSGRESAVWIMKMKRTNYKDWTPEMWRWAKKQISFISRMRGNQGELMENGRRTPKLKSLLIWGHNPYKYAGGGDIPAEAKYPVDANSLQVMLKYASKEDAPAIQEQIAKLKQEHKEKYQKHRKKYKGGGKPSDIASAILGLKALLKYPELLEKFDKENIEYTIKGLEILDKMHPSEIDPNDTSSGVKFIPYKDYEIMYDPDTKNYYANDAEFDSLEDAKAFLDSGKISDSIRGAMHYEVYGYSKGGSVNNQTLLAPNGKPSNLNPEQYKLVRTPEFKAWFGDWEKLIQVKMNDSGIDEVSLQKISDTVSKVVDENGEPLVVYHGSNSNFNVFVSPTNYFFFSDNLKVAESYRNKYIFKIDNEIGINEEQYELYKEDVIINPTKIYNVFLNIKDAKIKNYNKSNWLDTPIERDIDKRKDGFIAKNIIDGGNTIANTYIVFKPENIKLADGTNTTFDSENPDIRFEDGGKTDLTYKAKYNKKYGYDLDESHSLEEIASKTGISLEGLQEIFNKGVGAYRTNPESVRPNVKSPEQWGMARVYSAVMGGKTARIDSKELKMKDGGKTDSEMNTERYVVKPRVKFGMVFGYVVYDNLEKKNLPYDYDEDEQWKAQSKADLQNALEKNRLNKMEEGDVTDKKDTVTLDIPLLIRLLELSREDIQSDADLHKVVENMLDLKNKEVLTMEDYDKISQIAKEKLISQAHENLTRKQGRPEYAPNSREIEAEIERMINSEKQKLADGGMLQSDIMVVLQSPTEMLDEINYNAQFKPEF